LDRVVRQAHAVHACEDVRRPHQKVAAADWHERIQAVPPRGRRHLKPDRVLPMVVDEFRAYGLEEAAGAVTEGALSEAKRLAVGMHSGEASTLSRAMERLQGALQSKTVRFS